MIPERTGVTGLRRVGNSILGFWRYVRNEGRTVTNVVFFMIVAVFLILALIVNVFRIQPHYTVFATFNDSGGVFTGQEVTYRGVSVGTVGKLTVVRDGVKIALVIDKKFDKIPKDGTKARVIFKSAVGEQFIDLLPDRNSGPYFASGDMIEKRDTILPVQQEDLLRLLDKVLSGIPPAAIHRLVDTAGEGLGGRGPELHDALAALDPVTKTLSDRSNELNDLAVAGDSVGSAFDATDQHFVNGVQGLGTSAAALGRGSNGLAQLLVNGQQYLPDIGGLIADRRNQLDDTIAHLAAVTRISYAHLHSLADTIDWLPYILDPIINSYDKSTNRIRFGEIEGETRNPPCSYGTPRRSSSEHGNAPYQPILDFGC
jgi:phospholipid/cholesterol/gamma-HCH transport system substrate-binding protein